MTMVEVVRLSGCGMCKKIAITVLFTMLLSSCAKEEAQTASSLRIGILPDQSAEELYKQYNPLFHYLSGEINIPFELTIPHSYDELLKLVVDKKLDLVYLGGVTFLKAHHEVGVVPLVMRDVDARFKSYFIVDAKNTTRDLNDFKGKTISFGSKLSTSGHFMPRHFLARQGMVDVNSFFSRVEYSDAHDETIFKVINGKVDLGAVNSIIVDQMLSDGRLTDGQIRVLYKTPGYVDYVWALNPDINEDLKIKIRDAFMMLSVNNPGHKKILDKIGALVFYPVGVQDFDRLKNIMHISRGYGAKE